MKAYEEIKQAFDDHWEAAMRGSTRSRLLDGKTHDANVFLRRNLADSDDGFLHSELEFEHGVKNDHNWPPKWANRVLDAKEFDALFDPASLEDV